MYTKLNDDDPLVGGFILTKLERGNEGGELYQIRRTEGRERERGITKRNGAQASNDLATRRGRERERERERVRGSKAVEGGRA